MPSRCPDDGEQAGCGTAVGEVCAARPEGRHAMAFAARGARFRGVTRGVGGRCGGGGGDAAGPSGGEGRCRVAGRGLRSLGRERKFLSVGIDSARVTMVE